MSAKKARTWAKDHGDISYFETSAKDGINIAEAFQSMAKVALQKSELENHSNDVL